MPAPHPDQIQFGFESYNTLFKRLDLGLSVSQLLHLAVNPSAPRACTSCHRYDSGCYYCFKQERPPSTYAFIYNLAISMDGLHLKAYNDKPHSRGITGNPSRNDLSLQRSGTPAKRSLSTA